MTPLVAALAAAYGVHLVFTGAALGWRGLQPGSRARREAVRSLADRLHERGIGVAPGHLAALSGMAALLGAAVGWALFGGIGAPVVLALAGAVVPAALDRRNQDRRRNVARDAWPRVIEEIRIRTTSLGRSLPQALFEVGASAPDELAEAFADARREWLLSTDLERALAVLRDRLADATADAVCETLLVAHQLGSGDIDRVLRALVDDRVRDLQDRKDARARQAGARFARVFTLAVPAGMALVGMSMGQGRGAYGSPTGQALVLVGLGVMGACWVWAGRILRLPAEQRVFGGGGR